MGRVNHSRISIMQKKLEQKKFQQAHWITTLQQRGSGVRGRGWGRQLSPPWLTWRRSCTKRLIACMEESVFNSRSLVTITLNVIYMCHLYQHNGQVITCMVPTVPYNRTVHHLRNIQLVIHCKSLNFLAMFLFYNYSFVQCELFTITNSTSVRYYPRWGLGAHNITLFCIF